MIKLLTATDSIEANLVLNLLKQANLMARIDGEYLQGGVGELQGFGSLRVMIREEDFAEGKSIVDDFLNAPVVGEEFSGDVDGALQS